MSGFDPDFAGAEIRVSPNFGPRREGASPDCIILHYTGMNSGSAAEAWLCNSDSEVSAHYLVHEDGHIVQMVREQDRAWHAGRSCWQRQTDINSLSIGIEIVNEGHLRECPSFPHAQVETVASLCRDICARRGIAAPRVLAHSDVAPGRKQDPGERFPWGWLARQGVGHFVEPLPVATDRPLDAGMRGPEVEKLQTMLEIYGYCVDITGEYDVRTVAVVEAFQRHFRPARVDGRADLSTVGTLEALLGALPRMTHSA